MTINDRLYIFHNLCSKDTTMSKTSLKHPIRIMDFAQNRLYNVDYLNDDSTGNKRGEEKEVKINLKNLPVNVRFHGFQLDLSSFYLDNDIVILPSWHEGFGYALLEGAAFGCAMIASNIPGPDSIVINNVNGSLIPARSQRGIEECILNYYNDRDMLLNHMKNAYIRSLDFEENKILAQMTDFLTNNQYRT